MAGRDVVVVGASAGGLEALQELAAHLPAQLPAAVLVTMHVPAEFRSQVPAILSRSGPLAARHARDGEAIEPGRVYVAPPDRHLLTVDGQVRLGTGPREHGLRPAVDPLFRSAARSHGPRVVGVVLSGMLDDGTAGLASIKRRGGTAVVQDPAEARHAGMPTSAIRHVPVDHVQPVVEIAKLLVELAATGGGEEAMPTGDDEDLDQEIAISLAADRPPAAARPGPAWAQSALSCPDCNGVLWERQDGGLTRFRCRVGHAFSPQSLAYHQDQRVDEQLWAALKDLEEQAEFAGELGRAASERGHSVDAGYWQRKARRTEQAAAALRSVLDARAAGQDADPEASGDGPG
jgi:two-component system, chemotaxis family, protein-glutamate methylesterase/glutaminase